MNVFLSFLWTGRENGASSQMQQEVQHTLLKNQKIFFWMPSIFWQKKKIFVWMTVWNNSVGLHTERPNSVTPPSLWRLLSWLKKTSVNRRFQQINECVRVYVLSMSRQPSCGYKHRLCVKLFLNRKPESFLTCTFVFVITHSHFPNCLPIFVHFSSSFSLSRHLFPRSLEELECQTVPCHNALFLIHRLCVGHPSISDTSGSAFKPCSVCVSLAPRAPVSTWPYIHMIQQGTLN